MHSQTEARMKASQQSDVAPVCYICQGWSSKGELAREAVGACRRIANDAHQLSKGSRFAASESMTSLSTARFVSVGDMPAGWSQAAAEPRHPGAVVSPASERRDEDELGQLWMGQSWFRRGRCKERERLFAARARVANEVSDTMSRLPRRSKQASDAVSALSSQVTCENVSRLLGDPQAATASGLFDESYPSFGHV